VRDRDPIDRGAYQHVFELAWDECPTCYADSPSTKAEYCLRSVFNLQPIPELCRYEIPVGADAFAAAKTYLESICGLGTDGGGRYPAVLLHYQANTSTEKKDLAHELARRVCDAVIAAGYVPVILDWDKRSPLPDGVRTFNPDADAPVWGNTGTGNSEVLAALIAQSRLFIGVDSGPLHVAGSVVRGPLSVVGGQTEGRSEGETEGNVEISTPSLSPFISPSPPLSLPLSPVPSVALSPTPNPQSPTPVIAVWTGHHPLHYFCLADHVTHLVPEDHASRLRGDRAVGQAFFEKYYRHHVYRQLTVDLPALVVSELIGEDLEQTRNKEFLRQLRATGYTESYYLEHKLAGVDYLSFGEWQQQYGRWLVDSFGLKEKRVLDVGCACGSILRGLAQAGAIAEGVDLCEAMVRRGREEWPDMANVLHVCDAVNLHLLADGAFDWVHTAQVAEHWKPQLVPFTLRELARVTVPGGLLFCALDTEELFARQGRHMQHEDPTHVCIRPLRWWHEQLAEAGWQLCTDDYEPRLRAHPETFLTRYDWDWFVARQKAEA
jgi:2-polyprenyl-3-methyl-5-hydroxy-6-metoxy-1,4-benzoquinol methylase